jgi:hypothetical protein
LIKQKGHKMNLYPLLNLSCRVASTSKYYLAILFVRLNLNHLPAERFLIIFTPEL